jgi:hypothetical protein
VLVSRLDPSCGAVSCAHGGKGSRTGARSLPYLDTFEQQASSR